jgi:CRP-like cAMP-binding protein
MAIDVALRRYLAYTEDGRLILDLGKIRKRLMRKHTLVPLLCSAFPCSVLLPLWPLVDARLLQALRAVRVIRLAPYLLYPDPVQKQQPSNLEELLRTVRSSAFDLQFSLTKLAPLLGFYLGCVHYVACAYWAVVHVVVPTDEAVAYAAAAAAAASASGNGSAPSLVMLGGDAASTSPVWTNQSLVALKARIGISKWLPDAAYLKYGQMASYYLRAFYFATCNLTGLGAAVVPYAVPSVLFTLGCFVIGVMVFAYLTSAIVTLVMQADAAAVSYKQGYRQLLGFMQDAGIEHSIMHRASKWLSQWWQAHGGVNLDSIIRELPPSLALEIKTFVFERSAKGGSFFAPKGDGTPCLSAKELVRVAHDLRFEVYNHGEWVLRKGMLNDKFFLVAYGELQVLLDDGTEIIAGRRRMSTQTTNLRNAVVAELGKGECVGEHSAILKGKCEASVRARGSVELLVLQRDAIQRLVRRNPLIKHRIHLLMSTRFAENLYLTTGKVTMAGTATAMRCMLKFIAHWRRRKAERQQQAAAEGAHAAGSPAPAPTPAAAPRQPTPPMRQLSA